MLCEQHQAHLMDGWPMPGTDDDKKHAFFKQARLARRFVESDAWMTDWMIMRYHGHGLWFIAS